MKRETIISNIIRERNKRQEEVAQRLNTIGSIIKSLDELKNCSTKLQENPDISTDIVLALRDVNSKIADAETKAERLRNELRRLRTRTQRDTINIGIVGVPKQGKSTFLQGLTGLDEATIPTGSDFVTGACSYLRHDPEVAPGDAYAIVTPYTRREFQDEVLTPFCDKFDLHLSSVDDLPDLRLPDREGMMESQKRMLERLEQLQAEYHTFKDLLGQASTRIPKSEIRRYVAQCDEKCQEKYTYWYAIKKAEIHCRFPQDDIGRIMICDTPGLGDFTPGAQRALMEKLSTDMDVVFFLKRLETSDQTISERDTDFHGVVMKSNPNLSVTDWAYMILNCPNGSEPSDIFRRNLASKLPTRKGARTLDAKSKESVSTTFNTILGDIVTQLPEIDAKLISSYSTLTKDIQQALTEVIQTARKALPTNHETQDDEKQEQWTEVIRQNLISELESFHEKLSTGSYGSLIDDIDAIIARMRENPPQLTYNGEDARRPNVWLGNTKDLLRARYIDEFSALDASMEKVIADVRAKMQDILSSESGGRLGFITENMEGDDFWSALSGVISSTLSETSAYPLLKAIDNLTSIKMTFRAFVLPRLTAITGGLSNDPKRISKDFDTFVYKKGETIEDCKRKMESAWSKAAGLSETLFDEDDGELRDITTTPATAMAALIDEFCLLWLYYNGVDNAKGTWRRFYKRHAAEVWPEEYKSDTSMLAITRKWHDNIDSFEKSAKQFH